MENTIINATIILMCVFAVTSFGTAEFGSYRGAFNIAILSGLANAIYLKYQGFSMKKGRYISLPVDSGEKNSTNFKPDLYSTRNGYRM